MDSLYQDHSSATDALPDAPETTSNAMTKFQATIVIFLLCIGLSLLGWYIFEVSAGMDERLGAGIVRMDAIKEKINSTIEWEYRVESIPDRSFDQRINAMGKDGWELVFARRASDGADYSPVFSYEMILKRPKKIDAALSEKSQDKTQSSNKK
jgi:hypothetical protein